jgi:competence protein ComEC
MSQLSDKLHSAPFIRLLVPFIAGIVLGDLCSPELRWLFFSLSLCFSLLLLFFIRVSFRQEPRFGILLIIALLFLGLFMSTDLKYRPQPLPKGGYFAVFNEFPIEKEKSYRAIVRLAEPKIKVLAYFEKSDQVAHAKPGTVFWFRGQPELLNKTGNPFEFDYQAYAIRNKIGHRIYLKDKNIHLLNVANNLNLLEWSQVIRERLLHILENSGMKGEVFHLVSAISLGARDELEPETVQAFSKTGVIHVLAVSGMNVGLIFVVLDLLLRFLKRRKSGIILHTLIIIIAIWGYALITGLSASVLRAAAMFSFIVIGTNLSRHPNIYNTLAASAFVLLCFNPLLVYDVGFQLSYAAVLSIVYFQPLLYGLFYFKYWITDQIWILLSVSVAAQIGTLPFLLHYFHQFPTWFLLANLLVIPLVTVILYLTFIVFIVAPIVPFIGMLLTTILDWAGQGMLFAVRLVERLPYSILEGLYPSDLTLFLAVLTAVFGYYFVVNKSAIALKGVLILLITLLIFNNLSIYKTISRKELIVFNLPGKTLIGMTSGRETFWLTTGKDNTEDKLNYFTKPYEGFRGIKESTIICLSDSVCKTPDNLSIKKCFLNFNGVSLCLFNDRKLKKIDWEQFPKTDLIVLSENTLIDLMLIRKFLPETMIIDCRPIGNFDERNQDTEMHLNDPKYFNTSIRGAVQLTFRNDAESEKKILNCGYFNR